MKVANLNLICLLNVVLYLHTLSKTFNYIFSNESENDLFISVDKF